MDIIYSKRKEGYVVQKNTSFFFNKLKSLNIEYPIKIHYENFGNSNINELMYNVSEWVFYFKTHNYTQSLLWLCGCDNIANQVCFLIEPNNKVTRIHTVFDKDLYTKSTGTILLGDVVRLANTQLFIVDDVLYFKGDDVRNQNFEQRLIIINNILDKYHALSAWIIQGRKYAQMCVFGNIIETHIDNECAKPIDFMITSVIFKSLKTTHYIRYYVKCKPINPILNWADDVEEEENENMTQINQIQINQTTLYVKMTDVSDVFELHSNERRIDIDPPYACVQSISDSLLLQELANTNSSHEFEWNHSFGKWKLMMDR